MSEMEVQTDWYGRPLTGEQQEARDECIWCGLSAPFSKLKWVPIDGSPAGYHRECYRQMLNQEEGE